MVNVDFSPALVLGAGLMGGGLALYQLRRLRPTLSRDFDVVVSSIAIFSGGILVFQGWRLDPLLLFCQLLTAGMALSFAVEALRLREEVDDAAAAAPPLDPRAAGAPPPRGARAAAPLPPPRAGGDAYYDRWQQGDDRGVWAQESDRYGAYSAPPADTYYADAADPASPSGTYYDGEDAGYGSDGGVTGSYSDSYWNPPSPPASGDWGGYGDAPGPPPPAGDVGVGARPAAAPDDDWE